MNVTASRYFAIAAGIATGLAALAALAAPVLAQEPGPGKSPVCVRLEAQLAVFDRGSADPARAEQIRRLELEASKQQADIDRMVAQSRRMGCEGGGFFSLFTGQSAQCGPVTRQIQQMRANLDRIIQDQERLKGGNASREGQRQSILVALAQNNCGPQYRTAVTQPSGGLFDSLFRSGGVNSGTPGDLQSSTFRTVCVRLCDGFYFPVSYQTQPSQFIDDEKTCQRTCPGAEVALYSHRNPGEDINQAVSIGGQLYTALPQAFRYRQELSPTCSCKRTDQSWADALSDVRDPVAPGDIVVTNERSRALAQPRDAQGRPIRASRPTPGTATTPLNPSTPAEMRSGSTDAAAGDAATPAPAPKKAVRQVGPPFIPSR